MIFNPYKPFRFTQRFGTDAYDNEYVNYAIEFGRYNRHITTLNQWITIYKGKSLVICGKTTIEMTSVLYDYLKRNTFVYNEEQGFQPHNTIKPLDTNESVEMLGDIANTDVRITFTYGDVEIMTCVYSFSIYDTTTISPYSVNKNVVVLYQKQTIENHIPLIYTQNYWISFDYAKYQGDNTIFPLVYNTSNNNTWKLETTGDHGNYSVSLPLIALYQQIGDDETQVLVFRGSDVADMYIGGTASFAGDVVGVPLGASEVGSGSLSDGTRVILGYNINGYGDIRYSGLIAVVDACPSEWYMAWSDLNGWHSVALSSAWEIDDRETFTIKNIYDEERNMKNRMRKTFNVKSKKLNYNEILAYNHIIESTYVILYNSKTDENYFCHLVENNIDNTKQKDKKYFECQLREIINKEN